MKLPKSILLMGREIGIEEQDNLVNDKGEALDGRYEHSNRRILLERENHDLDKFETFCHEAAHAVIIFSGWDQRLNEREVELLCQLMVIHATDIIKGFNQTVKKSTGQKSSKRSRQKVGKRQGKSSGKVAG